MNYDGTQVTSRSLGDLIPLVLGNITDVYEQRPDLILAAWPDIVGPGFASMSEAVSFVNGVITVKVKNSTLLSLLNQNDKPQLLANIRKKFPNVTIQNIIFRMG